MSIVSRIFSSRSSSRINARLAFFMDNLFAIGFGLGLRYVIDNFANHDIRVTSSLVGLWEGVVTFHFLKKLPRSLDPYIAYATRLFVDFMVTENVTRLILVVVWTGLGMILADIAPAIWYDVGGRRKWRRVRRDLYYMTRSVPRLPPLFPRARVVRFSPPVRPTEISESVSAPSVASPVPKTDIVPPTPVVTHPRVPKRPIPGGLPSSIISETDSEATSALGLRPSTSAAGTSHAQFTIRQRAAPSEDIGSHTPSTSVDGSNVSSEPSSTSTETVSLAVDVDYQEENEIQALRLDKGKGREVEDDSAGTPIRSQIQLPPTPSDSYRPHPHRTSFVPTITGMPSIPDFFESGLGSDWENIRREEAETEQQPQPLPPVEKEVVSPPVQYEPYYPPPSVYEPTPRPETFDRDLWDDVSNAAPPTPFKTTMPPQRPTRPPPPTSIPRSIPVIPQPIKKPKKSQEPVPPPRVPQTPLYGNTWDTEKDQLPPPTPEVLPRTPIHNSDLGMNQGSYTPPPVKSEHQEPVLVNQDAVDPSTSFDDPWNNPSQPPEEEVEGQQDTQQAQDQFTIPPTPQNQIRMPPTPQFTRGLSTPQDRVDVPFTPQLQSTKVSSTPLPKSTTVLPTPRTRPGTVPSTPQTKSGTVPPTPLQKSSTVLPTPQQKPISVPPTPHQKLASVPPTPQQQPAPVPPMPEPQTGARTFTPQQQPAPIPPTPQRQPAPVPPTPQHQTTSIPPTPRTSTTKIPPTSKQKTSPPSATPQRESSPSLPPTSQQTSSQIPPAAVQQNTTEAPPTTQDPIAPVPPTPHQQQTQTVYPTPKIWAQTLPPSPRQRNQPIPPTPSQRSKTVPSTPRDLNKPIPPTPLDGLTQKIMKMDGGNTTGDLGDPVNQKTRQSNEGNVGDLVDLGDGETGGSGENGNEAVKVEGEGEDNNGGGSGGGESSPQTPEDDGFVQVDAENNPLSPASSGYSSVAGVPSEIKERNKQAIIIRAQIEEMTKTITRLKEEKLKAEGKEELDPLSEESTLKGEEIHKAEKSLEKLKKRAEKRYQAAVESTNQLSLPKNLELGNMNVPKAIARLEDVLGLYFNSDRKSIVLNINTPKGGPGKSMKTALTKLLEEYGIKPIQKATGVSISLSGRSYTEMVSAFRQKHAKADS
ncbi:hypothetical protein Agabi119p4_2386 [Agaricus bisporus var. burnettii]|uniref:Uncharacterized protein n=1 Tax=Agaricus bisporus var. burnettii TaxID=192524 RepID=A0A8H7F980_AGABI|nr:hypothetical protein Agabi119p4_2386 [Agaricus bisporus var. burnettii]